MWVNLGAKVFSEAVGNLLNNLGPEEAAGTGKFFLIMKKLFDCLNFRDTKEHMMISSLYG